MDMPIKRILVLYVLAMVSHIATAHISNTALCSYVSQMNQVCFPKEPYIDQKMKAVLERVKVLEELVNWYRASNGNLYKVFTEEVNYSQAIQECKKYGATLAIAGVIDPDVRSELRKLAIGSGANHIYVGADDRTREGIFVWVNGQPVRPGDIDWRVRQPDNAHGGQDCAVIKKSYAYKYDDVACTAKYSYVCEK